MTKLFFEVVEEHWKTTNIPIWDYLGVEQQSWINYKRTKILPKKHLLKIAEKIEFSDEFDLIEKIIKK